MRATIRVYGLGALVIGIRFWGSFKGYLKRDTVRATTRVL